MIGTRGVGRRGLFGFYPAVSVDDEDLGGFAVLVDCKDDREVVVL